MQKTTFFVLLALVAFTSARTPTTHQIANKQDVTMAKIFKIMETISHINWKLIDHEKLANKYVSVNGKDVEIARFVQILERTSKINWKLIGSLFEQKKISLHQQATVNGQQINLSIMLKALESVCEIDWTQFVSTAAAPKKSSDNSGEASQVSVDGKKVNLNNIAERLQRISQINWEKFDEKFEKK